MQISKKAGVGEVLLYTDNPATHTGRLRRRVVLWGRMWVTGPQDQTVPGLTPAPPLPWLCDLATVSSLISRDKS